MESPLQFRRRLRREATPAESKLWAALRDRQLDGHKFRRQHPIDDYVVDFYCVQQRLVVEIDGDHHERAAQHHHDQRRAAQLEQRCVRVIRFSSRQVLFELDHVLEAIAHACDP